MNGYPKLIIKIMKKIQILVNILAVVLSISFIDGAFELELSDDLYVLLGAIMLFLIIWLLRLVNKKETINI